MGRLRERLRCWRRTSSKAPRLALLEYVPSVPGFGLLVWFGLILAIRFFPAFARVLCSFLQVALCFLRGFFGFVDDVVGSSARITSGRAILRARAAAKP